MTYEGAATALATATNWHKSSRSHAANGCVEIGSARGYVGVRDTKLGVHGPILAFTGVEWTAFTARLRTGEFDG